MSASRPTRVPHRRKHAAPYGRIDGWSSAARDRGATLGNRQSEVVAQGRPGVFGAEHALFLQQRHDGVGELVEPVRGDVRYEDETVGGILLDEVVDAAGDRGGRT